jgi:hypothetical protein
VTMRVNKLVLSSQVSTFLGLFFICLYIAMFNLKHVAWLHLDLNLTSASVWASESDLSSMRFRLLHSSMKRIRHSTSAL